MFYSLLQLHLPSKLNYPVPSYKRWSIIQKMMGHLNLFSSNVSTFFATYSFRKLHWTKCPWNFNRKVSCALNYRASQLRGTEVNVKIKDAVIFLHILLPLTKLWEVNILVTCVCLFTEGSPCDHYPRYHWSVAGHLGLSSPGLAYRTPQTT